MIIEHTVDFCLLIFNYSSCDDNFSTAHSGLRHKYNAIENWIVIFTTKSSRQCDPACYDADYQYNI